MPRPTIALAGAALVAAGALALAWIDVLPGGWTLRGWFIDRAARAARLQREHSAERLAVFAAENPTAPAGAIVFLGSSTIERFPLEEAFPGRPCLDRGIGNETALECRTRLEQSLPAAPPGGFVVYLASLDFRRERVPPLEVARRAGLILDALRRRYPTAPIAQIGLLSERDANPDFVRRWRAANAALETAARRRGVAWITVDRPPITTASGALSPELSADRLHLAPAGYEVLAGWILQDGGALADLLARE